MTPDFCHYLVVGVILREGERGGKGRVEGGKREREEEGEGKGERERGKGR